MNLSALRCFQCWFSKSQTNLLVPPRLLQQLKIFSVRFFEMYRPGWRLYQLWTRTENKLTIFGAGLNVEKKCFHPLAGNKLLMDTTSYTLQSTLVDLGNRREKINEVAFLFISKFSKTKDEGTTKLVNFLLKCGIEKETSKPTVPICSLNELGNSIFKNVQ